MDLSGIGFSELLGLEDIKGFFLAIDKVKNPEEFKQFQDVMKEAWIKKVKEKG